MTRKLFVTLLVAPVLMAADAQDFIRAIRANDLAGLKSLIASKADVNIRGDRSVTPLMYAAAHGSPDAVKILLDAGADVNAKNAFDATALLWGANSLEKVKLLIDKGADVDARTKQGKTTLLVAAQQDGSEEVVKLLLAKGADAKVRDSLGFTPLLAATGANDLALIRLFANLGADVNARDMFGNTPLMNSAGFGNVAAMKLLIEKGAKVNDVSGPPGFKVKNGVIQLGLFTPLTLAATYGPPEAVKLLLDAGADVNAADCRGMTPIMLATSSEHQNPAILTMLLAKSADPGVKSKLGESTYDWARKFGRPEVLRLLKQQPVSVTLASVAEAPSPAVLRSATEQNLALLQNASVSFFKTGGCVGCHHQNTTDMAVGLAADRGLKIDKQLAAEQMKVVRGGWMGMSEGLLQRIDAPGGEDMVSYSLWGMAATKHPADALTDAMVFNVAALQRQNGTWPAAAISRPPTADSTISRTVLSMRALQLYGSNGRKAEYDERIRKAAAWLQEAVPTFNEERGMQLLGLKWTGADKAKIARLAGELRKRQRKDGGWAQNDYLASDAYATGMTLYALNQAAGLSTSDSVYRRGLAFLMSARKEDGSWHVKSRSPKFQPYFQSGFPHDHDQWISVMATAWGTMAMTLAAEPQQLAAR